MVRIKSISKLNSRVIKTMASGDEIKDPGTRGLSIWRRVNVTTWWFRFVSPVSGKRKRFKIGEWPAVGIEEAQRRAREARDLIDRGGDPADPPKALTVSAVAERYIDHVRSRLRTAYETERVLRKDVLPAIGAIEIDQIKRRDIIVMFDAIEKPYAANHALAYASTFFNWCVDRDLIEVNPASGIKRTTRNPEKSRERVLSNDELKALWQASFTAAGFPAYYGAIVRLLILTGCRRNEVASMKTDQISGPWWTIPAELSKNGRPHNVFLTRLAMEQLPQPLPGGRLFTSGVSWSRQSAALYKQAGLENVRLHDCRRTMASGMQALSIRPEVIEACLNHMPRGIRGVYQRHDYAKEKEEAWKAWSDFLENITN